MKFLVVAAVVSCASAASINAGWVLPAGNIGTSGILRKDGSTDLFGHDFAHDIVAIGPAGIVFKNRAPIQLDDQLRMRNKRSAGYVLPAGNIGYSGIVRKDGSVDLFDFEFAHNIAAMGPSGIVLKNGQPLQLDENLRIVGRSKRSTHIVGDTGMITSWGQIVQFREPFTKIVNEGPSGIVLSDGQNIQKPAE